MYVGSDLVALQSALDSYCADGFFAYDLNVGQINPYLNILVSPEQLALYPYLAIEPYVSLSNVYYTADFSPAVADFISAFQAACVAWADTNYPVYSAYNDQLATFPTFVSTVQSKG